MNIELEIDNDQVEILYTDTKILNTSSVKEIKTSIEIIQSQLQYYDLRFKEDTWFQKYINSKTPITILYKNKAYKVISHKETYERIDGFSKFLRDNPEIKAGTVLDAKLALSNNLIEL